MTSQEKLDAIYQFERSRKDVDRARMDEVMIERAVTDFLEKSKAAAKAGGPAQYEHTFPYPYHRLVPEIVKRLRAEGYRVKGGPFDRLVMDFVPRPAPPEPRPAAGRFSLRRLFGRG